MAESDVCYRCKQPVPWDKLVHVPTAKGSPRPCHDTCAVDISPRARARMSFKDRQRIFALGIAPAASGRRLLGMTPRVFPKQARS